MPEKVLTGTVKSIKEGPDKTQCFFSRPGETKMTVRRFFHKKRAARRQPKGNKEKNFKRECRAKRPDHLHWQQRTVSLL